MIFRRNGVGTEDSDKANMEVYEMKIETGMMNTATYSDVNTVRPEAKPKAEPQVTTTPANTQPAEVLPFGKGTGAEAQEQAENPENTSRRIKNAVDHANQTMRHAKTKCEFSYHEETKRVSIKVIDEETEEVIREIPPEETLEMLSKMWELAGLMVDEKR